MNSPPKQRRVAAARALLKRPFGGSRRTATAYFVVLSIGLGAVLLARGATGVQLSPAPSRSGLELESIDRAVDPCSDFYQFACGRWIAAHPVPADLAGIGRGREMRARTFEVLLRILTASTPDPERQKAIRYYQACMDEATIEAKGLMPIASAMARIDGLKTREELPALLSYLHSVAFSSAGPGRQFTYRALFDFRSQHEVPRQIAAIRMSGMALPYRELYFSTDSQSSVLRDAFAAHVRQIFAMLGASLEDANAASRAVLEIETALAAASVDAVQQRAPDSRRMSRSELQAMMPNFNWSEYLAAARVPATSMIDVSTPAFAKAVDTIVATFPISSLKSYLQWQVAQASVLMLPTRFRQADFEFFKRALKGQQQLETRSELCVAETDDRLGGVVGKAFVEETFGPKSKADMLALVGQLKSAMRDTISASSWMSDATKTAAKAKLASMVARIGYPDRWQDYASLDIKADDAFGNFQRALAFERTTDLEKIGRQPDSDDWPRLSVVTGEAGYRPERNEIIFPAGFLQPPFYSATRDPAVNYGAIGAVIGHEVTHAFDDIGRRLDDRGNWRDWWTPADANAFQERSACMVDQYTQYTAGDGVNLNGRLTLGENIADNGGVRLALLAYLAGPGAKSPPVLDGFTPVQRVFLGWAQVWCQNVRPEAERLSVATDPHAPGRHRVNGPLSNMPEFRSGFSCAAETPMVRLRMCRVW